MKIKKYIEQFKNTKMAPRKIVSYAPGAYYYIKKNVNKKKIYRGR